MNKDKTKRKKDYVMYTYSRFNSGIVWFSSDYKRLLNCTPIRFSEKQKQWISNNKH